MERISLTVDSDGYDVKNVVATLRDVDASWLCRAMRELLDGNIEEDRFEIPKPKRQRNDNR